ncbi:MAG: hypothetical protein OCC46_12000 [Pseudodesulfovibrio sp.]
MGQISHLFLYTFLVTCFLLPSSQAVAKEVQPAEVYQLVSVLSEEIEHLRWVMGRPVNRQAKPVVRNVSSHEVYFQALTLFEKINRLSSELVHDESLGIPMHPLAVTSKDVFVVVKATLNHVRSISRKLQITFTAQSPPLEMSRTPTDVFQAIVQANRQLNLMLNKQYSPSDVFRQVTVAAGYAHQIDTSFSTVEPPPKSPVMVPGKQPLDVFKKLLEAYALTRQVSEKMNLQTVEVITWSADEDIQPSDVFDIASLLVAELTAIHAQFPDAQPPHKVQTFRDKFPSHVYQRVGLLEILLQEIIEKQ